ncbi:DinB family protein [Pseudobacter ginsenosidimutans]|uniref:DinB family protein n=1 Tax=Pseudobacter ginsenosidimutans TaxID=661488 RepID=A0A4Q7N4M7_9BACT|nr:DinB family protein [Pseudobacter ginsenosidimutans]RZS75973.1 DinB family protein [Pseudobacter ginsenosidimutans]
MINRENLAIPPSMEGYVNRVKEKDPAKAVSRNTKAFRKLLKNIPGKKADYAYAPGKWTLKEMLQHIIDAERVFAFRALHIARKDINPLPGFDENSWADNSKANTRKWKDLIEEFFTVRNANEMLFSTLDDQQLQHAGVANNSQVSVATLAFVTAGHLDHHMNIILTRYLQPYPAALDKSATKSRKKAGKKKAEIQKKTTKKNTAKASKTKTDVLKKDVGFITPGKAVKGKSVKAKGSGKKEGTVTTKKKNAPLKSAKKK